MKTLRTSSPSRRSLLFTRITSSLGLTSRMLCISTSVCRFSTYCLLLGIWCNLANVKNPSEIVWTGLRALGFGANLQHYNPVIDTPVSKQWDIPSDWRLVAQLVFGSPEGSAKEKQQKPIEERVKIFGKK